MTYTGSTICTPLAWSAIRLRPGLVLEFSRLPDRCLALDGVVLGRHFDPNRFRFSFDHHENPRFGVLSTCEQVCDAIEMGLDPGRLDRVLVNDVDRDVAAAIWLLLHPERAAFVRGRVTGLGRIDSHGPSAPGGMPTPHLRADFPAPGTRRTKRHLRRAVTAVGAWLEGAAAAPDSLQPSDPSSFAILCHDGSIVPAPHGAAGLYAAGWTAFVLGRELPSGRWHYTYAKRSDFVPFDFAPFVAALNEIEPGWGGASTVGGGPRAEGSAIAPARISSMLRTGWPSIQRRGL